MAVLASLSKLNAVSPGVSGDEGDTDAHAHVVFGAVHHHRGRHRRDQPVRHLHGVVGAAQPLAADRELVPADSSGGVTVAQRLGERPGNRE